MYDIEQWEEFVQLKSGMPASPNAGPAAVPAGAVTVPATIVTIPPVAVAGSRLPRAARAAHTYPRGESAHWPATHAVGDVAAPAPTTSATGFSTSVLSTVGTHNTPPRAPLLPHSVVHPSEAEIQQQQQQDFSQDYSANQEQRLQQQEQQELEYALLMSQSVQVLVQTVNIHTHVAHTKTCTSSHTHVWFIHVQTKKYS